MTHAPHEKAPLGLELVILYKTVKGALEALAAVLVAFGAALGLAARVQDYIAHVAAHLTREWSLQLAEKLFHEATTSHLRLAAVALVFDAALTSLEGWGLERRKRWAPWLVVVATSVLIPYEIWALFHHPSPLRIAMLIINVAIVAYLALTIWHEHEKRHPHLRPPSEPPSEPPDVPPPKAERP